MLRLPDFEVVAHVIVSKFSADLIKEIESISRDYELDECTEFNGIRDYHWMFSSWSDAVAASERLKHLTPNPNLRLLRVKANYDSSIKPISYKDLVRPQNTDISRD
jgi:hypothetical protein